MNYVQPLESRQLFSVVLAAAKPAPKPVIANLVVKYAGMVKVAKTAFPLVGTHTFKLYGDGSIANGVQISAKTTTFTTSTADGVNYHLAIKGGASFSMLRSGSQLSINPQFQPYAAGRADNAYMISAGSCGALVLMSQTDTNDEHSLNVGLHIGTWISTQKVTTSQLVGTWKMNMIGDDNLRDHPATPFSNSILKFTITNVGNGEVLLKAAKTSDHPAINWVLKINGSTLELKSPFPVSHYFSMVTDGQHIVMANIGVELNDATDVAASIGMAVRT